MSHSELDNVKKSVENNTNDNSSLNSNCNIIAGELINANKSRFTDDDDSLSLEALLEAPEKVYFKNQADDNISGIEMQVSESSHNLAVDLTEKMKTIHPDKFSDNQSLPDNFKSENEVCDENQTENSRNTENDTHSINLKNPPESQTITLDFNSLDSNKLIEDSFIESNRNTVFNAKINFSSTLENVRKNFYSRRKSEDDVSIVFESQQQKPVRRKRGRPRKNPIPVTEQSKIVDDAVESIESIENFIKATDRQNIDNKVDLNLDLHESETLINEQLSTRMSVCRLCAQSYQPGCIMFMYDDKHKEIDIEWKINSCLPIKVEKNDGLPHWICDNCYRKIDDFYKFIDCVLNAEQDLIKKYQKSNKASDNDTKLITKSRKQSKRKQNFENYQSSKIKCTDSKNISDKNVIANILEDKNTDIVDFDYNVEYLESDHEDLIEHFNSNKNVNSNDPNFDCQFENQQNNFISDNLETFQQNQNVDGSLVSVDEFMKGSCDQNNTIVEQTAQVECRHCNKLFDSVLFTTDHSIEEHSNVIEGLFPCCLCEYCFNSTEKLQKHVLGLHFTGIQTKFYQCTNCDSKYATELLLQRHFCSLQNNTRVQDLSCKICNIIFPSKIRLAFHSQFHFNGAVPLFCTDCEIAFKDEGEFFDHKKVIHDCKANKNIFCDHCNKTFPSLKSYKMHEKLNKNIRNYRCYKCEKTFLDKQTLKEHSVMHLNVKPFQCRICGKYLNRASRLKRHLLTHESEETEPTDIKVCSLCAEAFSDEDLAAKHDISNHIDIERSNCIEDVHIDKVYRCEYCERCFYTKDGLNNHRSELHTLNEESNPYKCHICFAQFPTYARCTTHKTTHGYFKNGDGTEISKDSFPVPKHFLCEHCGKSYLHWTYLGVHRRLKHSKTVYMYKCSECPQQCPTSWGIAYHRKTRHPYLMSELTCKECNPPERFQNRKLLMEHIEQKHAQSEAGNQSYQCEICGKTYIKPESLEMHKHDHTGSTDHVCFTCGKSFVHSVGLQNHMQSMHSVNRSEWKHECPFCERKFNCSKQDFEIHLKKHSGQKPYECIQCGKTFRIKSLLTIHMRTHTDERPFPCGICGLGFRRSYALKVHKMIHDDIKPFQCSICQKKFRQRPELQKHTKVKHSGRFVLMVDSSGPEEKRNELEILENNSEFVDDPATVNLNKNEITVLEPNAKNESVIISNSLIDQNYLFRDKDASLQINSDNALQFIDQKEIEAEPIIITEQSPDGNIIILNQNVKEEYQNNTCIKNEIAGSNVIDDVNGQYNRLVLSDGTEMIIDNANYNENNLIFIDNESQEPNYIVTVNEEDIGEKYFLQIKDDKHILLENNSQQQYTVNKSELGLS